MIAAIKRARRYIQTLRMAPALREHNDDLGRFLVDAGFRPIIFGGRIMESPAELAMRSLTDITTRAAEALESQALELNILNSATGVLSDKLKDAEQKRDFLAEGVRDIAAAASAARSQTVTTKRIFQVATDRLSGIKTESAKSAA